MSVWKPFVPWRPRDLPVLTVESELESVSHRVSRRRTLLGSYSCPDFTRNNCTTSATLINLLEDGSSHNLKQMKVY